MIQGPFVQARTLNKARSFTISTWLFHCVICGGAFSTRQRASRFPTDDNLGIHSFLFVERSSGFQVLRLDLTKKDTAWCVNRAALMTLGGEGMDR